MKQAEIEQQPASPSSSRLSCLVLSLRLWPTFANENGLDGLVVLALVLIERKEHTN
jgi:hypothetical protein